MVTSTCCMVARLPIVCQFVLVLSLTLFFRSAASLQFIENESKVDSVTLEINSTVVNYSINCSTDDPNASTTLFYNSQQLQVGKRISLDKQVYTIHGLVKEDAGLYLCKATSSQGGGTIHVAKQMFLVVAEEFIPCCPDISPFSTVVTTGTSTNFTCHVKIKKKDGIFPQVAIGKYLSFRWYKKEGSVYAEIPYNETSRHNESSSVLMIRNAKVTSEGGMNYHCTMSYRGRTEASQDSRLAVHADLNAAKIEFNRVVGSAVVNESNKVNVRCKAVGYPVPTITWLRNGTEIPVCIHSCADKNYQVWEVHNEVFAFAESHLQVKKTEYPRDHGTYTCMANNSLLQSDKKDVEISIQTSPTVESKTIWVSPHRQKVFCKVIRTNPLPTFNWQYQSGWCLNINPECKPPSAKWENITEKFVVSPPVDVATVKSTLNIPENMQSAFFRCVATNVRGSDDYLMRFFSSDTEAITMIPTSLEYEYDEDDILKLRCVMLWKGFMITWYKNGQQLTHAADARINITWLADSEKTWTELVVKKTAANDSGEYICGAKDGSGRYLNASNFIKINKVYPPRILSFMNQTVFVNQTVYQPTTVNLYCNITAHPTPKVVWLKDKSPLEVRAQITMKKSDTCKDRSLVSGFYQVKNDVGRLVICDPSHAIQTGLYTCQASNRKGTSNATAFLNVLEDPVIISPSKEVASKPVSVKLGILWNATCKATGNPMPSVYWKKEKGNKTVTPKRKDSEGVVLTIASVTQTDLGNYFCVAENWILNSMAVRTTRVELVLADPSGPPPSSSGLTKGITITISVLGVILFLCLIVGFAFCCFIRNQRKQIKEYHSQFFPVYLGDHQIDPDRTLLEQCNNLPYDPAWEFPEDRLELGEVLGEGAFGQVIKAEAIGITDFHPRDKSTEKVRRRSKMRRRSSSSSSKLHQDSKGAAYTKTIVAVKTLKEGATVEEYKDLASELKILIHVGEHSNIVNLLGACTMGDRLLVIMEYAPHGSLLKFLRGKRDIYDPTWAKTTSSPELELNISNLVTYAYEICHGMEFLASKKCVHRDLAARNVLVGEDYIMKIADFGLARDIYKSDLYVKSTSGVLPVKWMALESLFLREYTQKSDVWSFGICLWEIFTLGGTPYPGIPTEQLLDFLSEGNRMEQPQNCPLEMYTIMMDCWQQQPDDRPTFSHFKERIGRILELQASKRGSSAYIRLTEDDIRDQSGYYLTPRDSDSTMPPKGAAGYDRQSSEDIAHSPLPSLPRDIEHERELKPNERLRMLELEGSSSLSGNESGIELEEGGDEMVAAMELRPATYSNKKKKSKYKQTLV